MSNEKPTDDLNISLESHLVDSLRYLQAVLSKDLADTLSSYITSSPPPTTIPYSVLRSVSQWAQTTGREALRLHSPPLDPHAYTMIALLAGTVTSPERNFGTYVPPQDPEELEAAKSAERKSITALLNALLSILGSGFAVWWAADKLRWKNEWVRRTAFLTHSTTDSVLQQRVLLALFAAIVVAVAEAVLYLIWQSRRSQSKSKRTKPRHRVRRVQAKKDEFVGPESSPGEQSVTINTSVEDVADAGLRRRQ
ncbi:hypothetical protein DXG01_012368 [Tephrocybe rancida]|nr:hypothetical protein DXG01_012368 [Tephrocybe rancida]